MLTARVTPAVLFTLKEKAVCLMLVNNEAWWTVPADRDIVQAYRQIFQTAQKAPLLAKSCTNNTLCYAAVTAFDVQQGMQVLLFNQPDFPVIFEALRAALWGDASAFARGPIPDVAYVWSTPLLCNDFRKTAIPTHQRGNR